MKADAEGFLYPEHLPDRQHDTTSINARKYYIAQVEENSFPYIEMTSWFQALKEADTLPYSLISQTGAHWGFSSVLAADSLLRLTLLSRNQRFCLSATPTSGGCITTSPLMSSLSNQSFGSTTRRLIMVLAIKTKPQSQT